MFSKKMVLGERKMHMFQLFFTKVWIRKRWASKDAAEIDTVQTPSTLLSHSSTEQKHQATLKTIT